MTHFDGYPVSAYRFGVLAAAAIATCFLAGDVTAVVEAEVEVEDAFGKKTDSMVWASSVAAGESFSLSSSKLSEATISMMLRRIAASVAVARLLFRFPTLELPRPLSRRSWYR